jgi:hypothetical protein
MFAKNTRRHVMTDLQTKVALAIVNAARARIPLPPLAELEIDAGGGYDSHATERSLDQAQAAIDVVLDALVSDEVVVEIARLSHQNVSRFVCEDGMKAALTAAANHLRGGA